MQFLQWGRRGCIGDINNDGLRRYSSSHQIWVRIKLYLNKGNWKFDDTTAPRFRMKQDSMWSTGVVMVDINNDGWLDMYICNSGTCKMVTAGINYILIITISVSLNLPHNTGLIFKCYATQASFFDYDLDGDL